MSNELNFYAPQVTLFEEHDALKKIEQCYRICYKSEDKITKDSAGPFIHRILSGTGPAHTSPLEHYHITVIGHGNNYKYPNAITAGARDIAKDIQLVQKHKGTSFIHRDLEYCDAIDPHDQHAVNGNIRAFYDLFLYANDHKDIMFCNYDGIKALCKTLMKKYPDIFFHDKFVQFTKDLPDEVAESYTVKEYHWYFSVRIVTSRDILQQLVRHRSLSPSVESTRFNNYAKKGLSYCLPLPTYFNDVKDSITDIKDIVKSIMKSGDDNIIDLNTLSQREDMTFEKLYYISCYINSLIYNNAISLGAKPEDARQFLPGCFKTELILTGRYEDWDHFLELRLGPGAQPATKYIAEKIKDIYDKHNDCTCKYSIYV